MSNSQDPPLCATGCRFYGSPAQQNFCSKCFRDYFKKSVVEQEQPRTTPNTNRNSDNVVKVKDESGSVSEQMTMMNKKKGFRCGHESCNKRVGLTGFECKCGEVYCGCHRYPEKHSCPYDFKGFPLDALAKTLYSEADCKADKLRYRL